MFKTSQRYKTVHRYKTVLWLNPQQGHSKDSKGSASGSAGPRVVEARLHSEIRMLDYFLKLRRAKLKPAGPAAP